MCKMYKNFYFLTNNQALAVQPHTTGSRSFGKSGLNPDDWIKILQDDKNFLRMS